MGLAYLDGHLDLYDGQTSTTGEPADMPISVLTGNGPVAWSAQIGAPLVGPGQLTCSVSGTGTRPPSTGPSCPKTPGWTRN